MKRWIIILLLVLAVIVLVSPGIVGRLAEKSIESNVAWIDEENPEVSVTSEVFTRGWFTSVGRHRVELHGSTVAEFRDFYFSETGTTTLPTLVIETRIDHGLLPLSSLSRHAGNILPGLANTVSTFQLDHGTGELVELPGVLYSRVGLTGAAESQFLLEEGKLDLETVQAEWQGADLIIFTNPETGALGISGVTRPFRFRENETLLTVGPITAEIEQARSEFGFNIGTASFDVGPVEFSGAVTPLGVSAISFSAENEIHGERMNARSTLILDAFDLPGFGTIDFAARFAVEDLDAASLQLITRAIQDAQAADDPHAALQMIYPQIEGSVENLLAAGGTIRFEQFDVTLPQGKLESVLDVEFAALDEDADFSWPSVLLALTANMDLKVPVELFEFARMMSAEADALIAMGLLVRENDHYLLKAKYAQGLLNVNGAPMPVPLPGM